MDPLASISSTVASMAAANLARAAAVAGAAGADPGPATATAMAGSRTAADASVAVLKKVVDLQAASGAQMAQLIAGQVDLQA